MNKRMCPNCGSVGLEYDEDQPTETFEDINGGRAQAVFGVYLPKLRSWLDARPVPKPVDVRTWTRTAGTRAAMVRGEIPRRRLPPIPLLSGGWPFMKQPP